MIGVLAVPVRASELTAPTAPESAQDLMPVEIETFSDGLWQLLRDALNMVQPAFVQATRHCAGLISITLLVSYAKLFPGRRDHVSDWVGVLGVSVLLLSSSNTMIRMASQTVREISEYGRLLRPVLTAALAAQGGGGTATTLYSGTVLFDSVLSSLISGIAVPILFLYLCMSIVSTAFDQELIKKLKDFVKWLVTWCLKIVLYLFSGYMGITGVVSGSADAAAVKATKLAISGTVPVVGGILSDASETILVSAGIIKNGIGVYGVLAVLAIWIGPFIQIGSQYLLLKLTTAICGVFPARKTAALIKDYSAVMGMLLAMTGTICILFLISIVCFMKGVQ